MKYYINLYKQYKMLDTERRNRHLRGFIIPKKITFTCKIGSQGTREREREREREKYRNKYLNNIMWYLQKMQSYRTVSGRKLSFVTVRRVRRRAINAMSSNSVGARTPISRRPMLPLSTTSSFQSVPAATSLKVPDATVNHSLTSSYF